MFTNRFKMFIVLSIFVPIFRLCPMQVCPDYGGSLVSGVMLYYEACCGLNKGGRGVTKREFTVISPMLCHAH